MRQVYAGTFMTRKKDTRTGCSKGGFAPVSRVSPGCAARRGGSPVQKQDRRARKAETKKPAALSATGFCLSR